MGDRVSFWVYLAGGVMVAGSVVDVAQCIYMFRRLLAKRRRRMENKVRDQLILEQYGRPRGRKGV